jgi:hypothetical protein
MADIQELAGHKMSGTQALKYADSLLGTIEQAAKLTPKPLQLTGQAAAQEPGDILTYLAQVLGDQTLDIAQITKLLQDNGWLRHTAGRPVRYISDLLSRNSQGKGTNSFTRVRRGTYRVARSRPKLVYRTGP